MQNIQDYIESGILELYVLGALSPSERAEVEAQAQQYPAVRQELEMAQSGLENYATAQAVTPPAAMRERVLSNVLAQVGQSQPIAATTSTLKADVNAVADRYARRNDSSSHSIDDAPVARTRSLWAIAASVALLLSLIGNAKLYSDWKEASQNLVALENKQARIADVYQASERSLGELREQNNILRDDQFKSVALSGTKDFPTAHARVLFNPASKKVFLDVKALPALAEGKQYQLWALDKGKPVDAGVLAKATAVGDSLQQMKDIASAQAFAMTVEPVGGSVNPTLSTMTVIGTI